MTNPGLFTEIVTIQRMVSIPDEIGGRMSSWQPLETDATVYAAVEPLDGQEAMQARQMGAKQGYKVTVFARHDLNTAMRIVWGDVVLGVLACPKPRAGDCIMTLLVDQVLEQA